MTIPDYTTVVGVDDKHLDQLSRSWPTWKKFKPSLLDHPMLIFRDRTQVMEDAVRRVVDHPDLTVIEWPFAGVQYTGSVCTDGTDDEKYAALWQHPQRYKMLAGFVHVPAIHVQTPYWLKLDTCMLATGQDDWIDPNWFDDDPVIVAHRWGYTKPANQMVKLDWWAEHDIHVEDWFDNAPLDLLPEGDRVSHKRIISICAFFDTAFTQDAALLAASSVGTGLLPVPSQDGFMWYVAKRKGFGIKRVNMKKQGWDHRPVRDISMDVLRR